MDFPALAKRVLPADCLVFFDFEATQFTHRAIALGVYAVPKTPGLLYADSFEQPLLYRSLIFTEDKIGPVVTNMTGITKSALVKEGKSFYDVVRDVTKLLRPFKNKVFLSYGSMDLSILHQSVNFEDEIERNFLAHVTKHYFDFHHYLERRIVDENGQSLSLAKLNTLFGLTEENPHDPLSDAKSLAEIYHAYLQHPDDAVSYMLEHYGKNPYVDSLNRQLSEIVLSQGKAERADLIRLIKEAL